MHLAIDFGTSCTKVGITQEGHGVNVNRNIFPSIVSYLPDSQRLVFGTDALRIADSGTITSSIFKLNLKRNRIVQMGPYTLDDIMCQYFSYLAANYLDKETNPDSVIISIPNYFGLNSRKIIKKAAGSVFPLARIILLPEPVAALLGFNYEHAEMPLQGDILVADIGGGTTDFSFLTNSQHQQEIIVEAQLQMGNDVFSGAELDRAVLKNLLFKNFEQQNNITVTDSFITEKFSYPGQSFRFTKLLQLAEKVKIELGTRGYAYINEPDFLSGYSLAAELKLKNLVNATATVFARLEEYINSVLKNRARELGLFKNDKWQVDYVLLLGGASYTWGLTDFIKRFFPGITVITPEERQQNVVKGLCAYAEYYYSLFSIQTIYPFSFHIEDREGYLQKIPFDTANLDLNLKQKYKIYSLDAFSPFNLSADKDCLQVKIYETEADPLPEKRFMGQDLVLDINMPFPDAPLDIYLDLEKCCMSVNSYHDQNNNSQQPVMPGLPSVNSKFMEILNNYPGFNSRLLKDYKSFLANIENKPENIDYIQASLYKVLALLQFYKSG